jgi:peroxiredoxin Q/BCP
LPRCHYHHFLTYSATRGKVRRLYGVPNTFGLSPGRVTFVIDSDGIVRHVFSSQIGVERHVREALEALHSMS